MGRGKRVGCGFALMAFLGTGVAAAGPRLVVSMPELHSLVAALTAGVVEPDLLYPVGTAPSAPIGSLQKAHLVAADMVIWVGPGLESDLAKALVAMPSVAGKSMAVSTDIPLLTRSGYQGPLENRQASRALEIWSDPRLAAEVVRQITPYLVRLDPDHQELYLDNEIALVEGLRRLEAEIVSLLGPHPIMPSASVAAVDPYFRHRFLESTSDYLARSTNFVPVANADQASCPGPAADSGLPGPAYYFQVLRGKAQAISACLPHENLEKAAISPDKPIAGAS